MTTGHISTNIAHTLMPRRVTGMVLSVKKGAAGSGRTARPAPLSSGGDRGEDKDKDKGQVRPLPVHRWKVRSPSGEISHPLTIPYVRVHICLMAYTMPLRRPRMFSECLSLPAQRHSGHYLAMPAVPPPLIVIPQVPTGGHRSPARRRGRLS